MSGGAGHISDMNNRMKQNRSMKPSKRAGFKSNNRDLDFKKVKSDKLVFKKASDKDLAELRMKIKKQIKLQRIKDRVLYFLIIILMITVLYLSFF